MKNRSSKLTLLVFVLMTFFSVGCHTDNSRKLPPDNSNRVTISQGVWGNVWFWEGNFMPLSSSGTITAVSRRVYIYEPTPFDSVTFARIDGFYSEVRTKQVASIESDNTGFFQIELPAGKYSFFVLEDSLFYANGTDSVGHILPAIVTPNAVTKRQIDIQYRAAF